MKYRLRSFASCLFLLALLPWSRPALALEAGWTRATELSAEHLALYQDGAGNRQIWVAETGGFSVLRADGSLVGRFQWPIYGGSQPVEITQRIAVAGEPAAAWTLGLCCIGKFGPVIKVLSPDQDKPLAANLAAAFDVGRAVGRVYTIATDPTGRPWLATGSGVWMMARGSATPLDIAGDLWVEVFDRNGHRLEQIESIASGSDGTLWLLGSGSAGPARLFRLRVAGEEAIPVDERDLPAGIGLIQQIAVDDGGTLYLLNEQSLRRLNPDGTTSTVATDGTFGAALKHALFAGDTLWLAAANGVYRRSTVPAAPGTPENYGPAEYVADYTIMPAPGIEMGGLEVGGPAPDPAGFWRRTDLPLLRGDAGRSFYWGPVHWTITREPYREARFGTRRVIYYDKARMEITDPSRPPVTSGLLVVEMATGRLQLGDATFADRRPAEEAVAGDSLRDNPQAPTYASFRGVLTLGPGRYADRTGQDVTATLDRAGNTSENRELARQETRIAAYNTVTGHNIPRVFLDFMNQSGPVYQNPCCRVAVERIIDPLVAIGYPVTEPYWVRAKVAGVEQWVLAQLFERRALTYTPANPPEFRVEMGNTGQHYYAWRYDARPWEAR